MENSCLNKLGSTLRSSVILEGRLSSLLLTIMGEEGRPWPQKAVRAGVMHQLLGHLAALLTSLLTWSRASRSQ